MKFWTLACDCGCTDPLIRSDEDNNTAIAIYRTKAEAEIEASEYGCRVMECEVKKV